VARASRLAVRILFMGVASASTQEWWVNGILHMGALPRSPPFTGYPPV
jgi:hypothetical protein